MVLAPQGWRFFVRDFWGLCVQTPPPKPGDPNLRPPCKPICRKRLGLETKGEWLGRNRFLAHEDRWEHLGINLDLFGKGKRGLA